jgi:prepilin-type N-terminal cleavage/methylation domain-containing protein
MPAAITLREVARCAPRLFAYDRAHMKQAGFTLTEIAVVLLIFGLLVGGMLYTYAAQVDQSNRLETQRRLESAKDLLIGYAIVNGMLPCPATSGSSTPSYTTPSDISTPCTDYFTGFLPGSTIGFQPVDASGFALDAWNNRIRYAVSQTIVAGSVPHFTSSTNLKNNGVSTQPNDLVICTSSTGTSPLSVPPSCGTSISATNQKTLAALVLSPGKTEHPLQWDAQTNTSTTRAQPTQTTHCLSTGPTPVRSLH